MSQIMNSKCIVATIILKWKRIPLIKRIIIFCIFSDYIFWGSFFNNILENNVYTEIKFYPSPPKYRIPFNIFYIILDNITKYSLRIVSLYGRFHYIHTKQRLRFI